MKPTEFVIWLWLGLNLILALPFLLLMFLAEPIEEWYFNRRQKK